MSNLVKDCKSYLQVGDRIRTNADSTNLGDMVEGTVTDIMEASFRIDYVGGWYISFRNETATIEVLNRSIINNKQDKTMSLIKKLTGDLKRIFNKSMRVQYKASFVGECGKLTEEGRIGLESILRDVHEEALTKLAQEKIDEIKEDECK